MGFLELLGIASLTLLAVFIGRILYYRILNKDWPRSYVELRAEALASQLADTRLELAETKKDLQKSYSAIIDFLNEKK